MRSSSALCSGPHSLLASQRTHLNAECSPPAAAGGGAVLIEHGTSAAGRIKRTRSHRPRPPPGPPRSPLAPLRVLTRRFFRAGDRVPSGRHETPQHDRRAAIYYIVEITPQGIETFLEGFEEVGEAWDVVSRLQCEARRRRRKVRYEVRIVQGGVVQQPRRLLVRSSRPPQRRSARLAHFPNPPYTRTITSLTQRDA